MGFTATLRGRAERRVVELGLDALANLAHRGGLDADGASGDGAGILIDIPTGIVGHDLAVAVLFDWDSRARELAEGSLAQCGMQVSAWRRVPINQTSLGPRALASMPDIWQALIPRPGLVDELWERRLFKARKLLEGRAERHGVALYVPSMSCRTVVYKGLMAGTRLADFYLDLGDERCTSRFSVFHQRYSTNTLPDWRLAQPFRYLAHNGEINTVAANRLWMRAREAQLPSWMRPVTWPEGSDSASLDNVLESLVHAGADPSQALLILVPEAWQDEPRGDPQLAAFHRRYSVGFESWDGPAALAFSDGRVVGGALDRNGLRPMRYLVTSDGLVVAGSEAGIVSVEPSDVVERDRLGPGQQLVVDLEARALLRDGEAKRRAVALLALDDLCSPRSQHIWRQSIAMSVPADLGPRQRMHGWGGEDLRLVVHEMAEGGLEPTYSMGDDIPLAPLGITPRRIYGYLRQRFAQVTNPAIDPIRERCVMSLRTVVGDRSGAVVWSACHGSGGLSAGQPEAVLYELDSPLLGALEFRCLADCAHLVDTTLAPSESLRQGLRRVVREVVKAPDGIVILDDRRSDRDRAPLPMLLALGACLEGLLAARQALRKSLVVACGDAIDVHDVACLITCGAAAVFPHLAIESAWQHGAEPAVSRYLEALDLGLFKVMAKMGISEVDGYRGAALVEAVGLGAQVMQVCLPRVPSRVGGANFGDLERQIRHRHAQAWEDGGQGRGRTGLSDHGRVRFRRSGEHHAYNPAAVRALQLAARTGDQDDYRSWTELASMGRPRNLRELLEFKEATPVDLSAVEPATAIVTRFVASAMSLGALSPEAHATIALAMNRIGARSNTGEGGEDPSTYVVDGERLDNKIKQVASARFGVTPGYLRRADELEIKIAQGSKPGEGGQLPSAKVTALIAKLRHTQQGIQLISPPPHHDIYSIEDLAQLIYDLRAVNPRARVGVKLVAEAGVGTIAAGVVKAGADYVQISGHDGGTGASPLSSIKSAGVPWELGLAETQQLLVGQSLRERVTLRVDGGISSGRDIVIAALMGAEEFGLGTGLLVALGCDMARQCHLNTCPTGIATQRPELRAKFAGRTEHVANYLLLMAEEVRHLLARLGFASLEQAIGRVEALRAAGEHDLDLSFLLTSPEPAGAPRRRLWERNGEPALVDHRSGVVDCSRRALGAGLERVRRSYRGSAGQSFGAWCGAGTQLALEGEANDYVGKGLAGATIAIRPFADDASRSPVLAGNTCLYGATGGKLFVAGRVGERFAVRNSGAMAVVEGAGDHFCEYMTGGLVVALGAVGRNLGAGMTGGRACVLDCEEVNHQSVYLAPLSGSLLAEVRGLVEEHCQRTGSPLARGLLEDWSKVSARMREVRPKADAETDRTDGDPELNVNTA